MRHVLKLAENNVVELAEHVPLLSCICLYRPLLSHLARIIAPHETQRAQDKYLLRSSVVMDSRSIVFFQSSRGMSSRQKGCLHVVDLLKYFPIYFARYDLF